MPDAILTAPSVFGPLFGLLKEKFKKLFGVVPQIYQAPGRVNLIGEHTDYNDGFVMPAAIGFYTRVAAANRTDRRLEILSENYPEHVTLDLDSLPVQAKGHWSDYVVGVARVLAAAGVPLRGANLLVDGDVPQGAGLSSSASLEVAVGFALLDLSGEEVDRTRLALLCQKAENEFVGAQCGIMDQFVSSYGQRDRALLLDCRNLRHRLLPLPDGVSLVICNTMVKHSVAKGEYNQRRAECELGVRGLAKYLPNVKALRDVTPEDLERLASKLPELVMRRCRHVIGENARVLQAAEALESRDLEKFGQLMRASQVSLRDDFEVSCEELDLMVELAQGLKGVYGTRMTGGGFGGCTISLVRGDCVETFEHTVSEGYERATGNKPEIYVCTACEGAAQVA